MADHQTADQASSSKSHPNNKDTEDYEHEQDNEEQSTQSLESLEHDLANNAEMQQRAKVLFENLQTITSRVNAARAGAGLHRRGGDDVCLLLLFISQLHQ